MSFTNLPVRYGTHTYSYRVEELDVPMNYAVKYTNTISNENPNSNKIQTSVITNTSTDNVQINVKKIWLDSNGSEFSGTDSFEITAKLMRDWIEYGSPTTTTLMIRAVNPQNKVIKEWTTNKAYKGGSIEFSLGINRDIYERRRRYILVID